MDIFPPLKCISRKGFLSRKTYFFSSTSLIFMLVLHYRDSLSSVLIHFAIPLLYTAEKGKASLLRGPGSMGLKQSIKCSMTMVLSSKVTAY